MDHLFSALFRLRMRTRTALSVLHFEAKYRNYEQAPKKKFLIFQKYSLTIATINDQCFQIFRLE